MPQKSNHDFKENYPHVSVGTFVPRRVKDILTRKKKILSYASILEYEKTHNDLKFGNEAKTIIVVETSLRYYIGHSN